MSAVQFRSDMGVELVQVLADDLGVIRSARVSTVGALSGTQIVQEARSVGLIKYLMRERHSSPFEHNLFTFRIEAPIFVFREFQRHRIGWSYNEWSGRYSELDPEFYVPERDRLLVQTGKPGHYEFSEGTEDQHTSIRIALPRVATTAYAEYQRLLAEGIAKEVARSVLPVNIYSCMYATCNARSLMNFLSLRTHREDAAYVSHPQREIEMVAEQMEHHFEAHMPITYAAFNECGRVGG